MHLPDGSASSASKKPTEVGRLTKASLYDEQILPPFLFAVALTARSWGHFLASSLSNAINIYG